MALKDCLILLLLCGNSLSEFCPTKCDCDINNGLNRALCVNQNIVNVNVGVPKMVEEYGLSHNIISELDNYCFKEAGYTSIKILDLSYNMIFWIGIHAFAGIDKLSRLNLSNNRLRYIPSDLFFETPLLESLDLSGNVFESLKNEPFLMHSKLMVLNLNNCRIKSLPGRLFSRLPNLRKLDLSENYMVSISTELFQPMRRLERLELRNEYWQCNPSFIAFEAWVESRGITYTKQCKRSTSRMLEKMISVVNEIHEPIDINKVWNVTKINGTEPENTSKKQLTPYEKFDKEFSSVQAFILGLEIGLGIGLVGTYIWLRNVCRCSRLSCRRPQTRRQMRRIRREVDNDMRTNLLWSTVVSSDLETPPSLRRELSLPDQGPPYSSYGLPGFREASRMIDAIRIPNRSETPPPPYNDCHS